MIFSEQWVREWVDPAVDRNQLVHLLTMAGLEVDAVTPVAGAFEGVVVAEVVAVEPHPDAEKLRVCRVNDGESTHQVVCGAPNVVSGMKAPFARVGASLRAGSDDKAVTIKAARLRGVESAGMLCSAEELGLAESSDGLLVLSPDLPLGQDLRVALALNDVSIELGLTPNRGDCLGIQGLAREIGVLTRTEVTPPVCAPVRATLTDSLPVTIVANAACPRYLGRVIRGINPEAETPLWMRERLRRSGLRCIAPVVDVTNYVLLELGQPMHAFDCAKLTGGITVRFASEGEGLELLDGQTVSLTANTLVIADTEGAVAMAGIMGGMQTSVTTDTRDVFLECASFAPLAIAGRARHYGMHTDASHRYERGVDHGLQERAMERATALLIQIVGGEAGPVTSAVGDIPLSPKVTLRFASIDRVLGIEIDRSEVTDILSRLGMEIQHEDAQGITVQAPTFRFDIEREVDLIEELARVHGYDRLPRGRGLAATPPQTGSESVVSPLRLKRHLVSLGYQEVITYSFIDPKLCAAVCSPDVAPITLENPISADMAVMRPSLLPGLLQAVQYNQHRQQTRLRIFEVGQIFLRDNQETNQPTYLGGVLTGSRHPALWSLGREGTDFYDLKGDVESLLALVGDVEDFEFAPVAVHPYHPGQCARISRGGKPVGVMGALHPSVCRALGFSSPIFAFELHVTGLSMRSLPVASDLSRYPEVARDLAFVVETAVPAAALEASVRQTAGEHLTSLRIFDVFQGDAVGVGKKSIAMGLTWQHPSRTLGDDEISAIIAKCVKALEEQFNAKLRN